MEAHLIPGKDSPESGIASLRNNYMATIQNYMKTLKDTAMDPEQANKYKEWIQDSKDMLAVLNKMDPKDFAVSKGALYKRTLAGEKEDYMDWDKPYKEQSKEIQDRYTKAINKVAFDPYYTIENLPDGAVNMKPKNTLSGGVTLRPFEEGGTTKYLASGMYYGVYNSVQDVINKISGTTNLETSTGADMYQRLSRRLGSDAAASKVLYESGIRGNKYRGGKHPDSEPYNYVTFSDEDILENKEISNE